MNNPAANRYRVAVGTAVASSGMKLNDLNGSCRGVGGGDRMPSNWPCKKDHDISRSRINSRGRPYCLECEWERKLLKKYGYA